MDALGQARGGHGSTVVIGGEPGVGKSRLADELALRATTDDVNVLWGRGWEDAGAPAYWLWVQVLRALLRATPPEQMRRHVGIHGGDIAQILPELRALFGDIAQPAETESESARFQLFDSIANLFRNATNERPTLILLDDLHSADTPSILLLRFLTSQVSDMSLLIAGTYRDIELTPDHALTHAIEEMARDRVTSLLTLRGLPSEAVGEFIASAAGLEPAGHLVAAVWRETKGNPLFVGEAVRLLEAEGRLSEVGDLTTLRIAVPAGVRAVIRRRVAHLTIETGTTLELGAALGPEFSIDVLRRIGDLTPEEALDAIDAAVKAGLVAAVAGVGGRYRFSHALVRETLYDDLPSGRRTRLHARIADTLEEIYGQRVDAHLAELAHHLFQASGALTAEAAEGAPEHRRKAFDYAKRAGDEAARALAYEEAARLFRMALTVQGLDDTGADEPRAEMLLALGTAEARAGDLDSARRSFLEAGRLARIIGARELIARAALGYGGRHQWARPGNDVRLIPLFQDALQALGDHDDRLRLRLLTRLACAWRSTPERMGDSAALSQEAIDLARETGDLPDIAYALMGRFWATWWAHNPDERAAIATEMMGVARELGDGERLLEAHLMVFLSVCERGLMSEVRAKADTLRRLAAELREPPSAWLGASTIPQIALIDGDYAAAESAIGLEYVPGYSVTPGLDDVSVSRMHRFLLRREQGRVAEEESSVRASAEEFPWYPMHRAALAVLLLEIGRKEEATRLIDTLSLNHFAVFYPDNAWLFGMSLMSEAVSLAGDPVAAETLYARLSPFAGRHAIASNEGSVGVVDRYLGLLAVTMGRLDDGERHLTDAIAILDSMGARPWKAHAQHDLAKVLRVRGAQGDAERAAALDVAASAAARQIGMTLGEESGSDATELDVKPHREVSAGSPHAGSFTATFRREGEYWTIEFGSAAFRLHDSKGLRHLARLLRTPGVEVHALELAQMNAAIPAAEGDRDAGLSLADLGSVGPLLDDEAKASYRQRLDEIREERDEAERWNDRERVARLEEESTALLDELTSAFGLGGRARPAASSSERARVSATKAIRASLARIAEYSEDLSAHLEATVRTGTFCSYSPDPRAPISWSL